MMVRLSPRSAKSRASRHLFSALLIAIWSAWSVTGGGVAWGQEAEWIWSPSAEHQKVPVGVCYFRQTIVLANVPEEGQIQITCDNEYELFINGRRIGGGTNWKQLDVYDVTSLLVKGPNTIAVKATNSDAGAAGLVVRVVTREIGQTHKVHLSNNNWKTSVQEYQHWNMPAFNDSDWLPAKSFGQLAATLPWGTEVQMAGDRGRFKTAEGFEVEWVLSSEETGSLIAMTFNEFGQIVASQERGPLLLMTDRNGDGVHETVTTYSDQVRNCQGLLAINGSLLAVGDGPQGTALYRLTDSNRDGKIDEVKALIEFSGEMQEHGPHAVVLGPDGLIYVAVGNHDTVTKGYAAKSPHRNYYEGDLIGPRYEDPGGHATGLKAPGGVVLRTDAEGSFVELYAGGLRNAYDIAFNRRGDLFTYDSDMEWDEGMPWYRPTRINHLTPGAEFGWRSGWAKWPESYIDSLPAVLDRGFGSPTGVVVYDHFQYPVRYQDTLFVCDWSRGRINAIHLDKNGGTYSATAELFLEGRPLNVTDIAVAPDGQLYFSTGGRNTAGGIYRIVYNGNIPPEAADMGSGIDRAIRQPQLSSAWARQEIAIIRRDIGAEWGPQLVAIAKDAQRESRDRSRALDLMQLFGPRATPDLLIEISRDQDAEMRAKAAYLMGVGGGSQAAGRLLELVEDVDATVRRKACEALIRSGFSAPVEMHIRLLADADRYVAYAARRALENLPPEQWREKVLSSNEPRIFLQGATALLVAHPDKQTAEKILDRSLALIGGGISDEDFVDSLRVIQLALIRGELTREEAPALGGQLARKFPSTDAAANRELVRLLAYLQNPTLADGIVKLLGSDASEAEKLQAVMFAPRLDIGWNSAHKMAVLSYFEQARDMQGGASFPKYLEIASREFFADLTEAEQQQVLAGAEQWPRSALSMLAKFPPQPSDLLLNEIMAADRRVTGKVEDQFARFRVGVVAVLARSGSPKAMAYLRDLYLREPARRAPVAIGLAQHPEGENWPILVSALPIVDGVFAGEVLGKLATVDRRPEGPEPLRQAILAGLRAGHNGGEYAVALLEKWTGQKVSGPDEHAETALAAWQAWFVRTYPDLPEPSLPADTARSRWTFKELLSYLEGSEGRHGDPARGEAVFEQALCFKCHRYGPRGEGVGPDLTTVAQRFQKREILESILFPSHVISDQYSSRTVATTDGRVLSGMVAPAGPDAVVLLLSTGEKVELARNEIDEVRANKLSAMPDDLLNVLTLEQIADLFAYMGQAVQTAGGARPQQK